MLSNIAAQLSHLDLSTKFPLKAGKENLALAWLESIAEAGNGAGTVSDTELNELFVHEVLVPQLLVRVVNVVMD